MIYTILIDALCLDCHSDLLLSEGAIIEVILESIAGLILLDFFGDLVMRWLKVDVHPATASQPMRHHLQLQATSSSETVAMPLDLLQARLEEAISCALLEYYEAIEIKAVDVRQDRPPSEETTPDDTGVE